jgi:diguanylate cyclase (GGDEF)-like protein
MMQIVRSRKLRKATCATSKPTPEANPNSYGSSADKPHVRKLILKRHCVGRLFPGWILAGWLALVVGLPAQQYVFKTFDQDDGLKNLAVKDLSLGRRGLLWIGTENGVYWFSGSSFQRFGPEEGIADVDIQNIYSDPYGTIWAGTRENLFRKGDSEFVPAGDRPIHILGSKRLAAEDAGHLLVVDGQRLYRLEHDATQKMLSYAPVFSDQMIATHPELGQISSINIVDQGGNGQGIQTVWMGCGKKLCRWQMPKDSAQSQNKTAQESSVTVWGQDKGLAQDTWLSVLMDHDGNLWASGQHCIATLAKGAARFINRTIPGSDQSAVTRRVPMIADSEGHILVAREDSIARWNGSTWQIIESGNGLPHGGHISSLVFDAAGDLWTGNTGNGVYHWIGYKNWEGWSNVQGLPSSEIWNISQLGKDQLFIGTSKGPAWINLRTGTANKLFSSKKWTYGQVSAMGTNRDGSLGVGTFSGAVLRVDPHTGATTQTAKLPSWILHGSTDPDGNIFFVTSGGIYKRAAATPNATPTLVAAAEALVGPSKRFEQSCAAQDGTLWFLGDNRILSEKNDHWTAPPIDGMPHLSDSLISLSCAPDKSLWVTGAQTGTWRLTLNNGRLHAWQLQLPNEYRSLISIAVLADRRGWIWLGTDEGILVWNGHEWRHLTNESGLIWNDVNQGILYMDSSGTMWVGTSGGLAHLMHPEYIFKPAKLSIMFIGIRRGGKEYLYNQKLDLPWSTAPLGIKLATATQLNVSESFYEYRMDGLQSEWILTQNPLIVYPALGPGKYTFMARIRNPGLNAISDPVRVEIIIQPPWWRSNWFYLLCGLVLFCLWFLVARLRTHRMQRQSKQLEMQVRERTRELELSREQLRIQATHDELTGMLNRPAVLRVLTAEMDRVRRENGTLVLALIDLDHFKDINDTYGHLAGDEALRWFAASVGAAIRVYDHVGRYGGEEFMLVLSEIPHETVDLRLESLHAAITDLHVRVRGVEFRLTCSVGATIYNPADGPKSVESLLAIADQALYAAKEAGRNRAYLFETADEKLEQADISGNFPCT